VSAGQQASYLAFDLGASTSRAFLGTLAEGRLEMTELHRFTTPILEIGDHLFWDVEAVWTELHTGLGKARAAAPGLRSLSVDSWAVDYVSLDATGAPVRNPHCYRDPRTEGIMERALEVVPAHEIYSATGIQFLPFNTLYQLLAEADHAGEEGDGGVVWCLPIADYFNYRFSGRQAVEVSMASTTQLMDVNTRQWSASLMQQFGLEQFLWPEIVPSATRLGSALQDSSVEVVATCSHDTGCAVAAAPAAEPADKWAYISCGTWSLMGVERNSPLLTASAREAGFTNEAGLDGTIRFLKNLTGLWVLQECMREWRMWNRIDWPDLEREARAALREGRRISENGFINLEDSLFLPRGPMEERIHTHCRKHGLRKLESRGEIVLAILASIAESYRRTLDELERITGVACDKVHLFGGGSQNALLCELTADACRCDVVAGPVEATAMGNLLIQARAMGDLPTGASVRDVSAASSTLELYLPDSK
jgi:rhamnulokinase